MMFVICSVFDIQARSFSTPFTLLTTDTAIRDFARAVVDSKGMVDKFPADYQLFQVGAFDEDSGQVFTIPQPVQLAKGLDYLPMEA